MFEGEYNLLSVLTVVVTHRGCYVYHDVVAVFCFYGVQDQDIQTRVDSREFPGKWHFSREWNPGK